jgi:ABC-2 type transport system ATP-binding protein
VTALTGTAVGGLATSREAEIDSEASRADRAPAVLIHDLTKRFAVRRGVRAVLRRERRRYITAVDQVSLAIAEGSIFGLLGANGAGKTTIFKMLATTTTPDAGSIEVAGHDAEAQPREVRRVLANVPADERSLNWRLNARDNLALFAALHGLRGREATARVDELLRVVGLADTGPKLVAAFSSGMRQRLLIARALLSRPRVLLLDEPTRALDPVTAVELREFIRRELVESTGCTVAIATHNAEEAFTFCHQVAVLHRGRLLATGHAATLASRFAEDRCRIRTADPHHAVWGELRESGTLRAWRVTTSADGWTSVEAELPGGPDAFASVLRIAVARGASIASFEHVPPSLADMLTRIIGAAEQEVRDA